MAKCKYPNEVCGNMKICHGVTYCDSVPCSLKDEFLKQTNADRIRSMTNDELLEFIMCIHEELVNESFYYKIIYGRRFEYTDDIKKWLESECYSD